MRKMYEGGCHCGAIKYEADIDFEEQGTSKCNCSLCTKLRWWSTMIKPSTFRLLTSEDALTDYRVQQVVEVHNLFCKRCGIHSFHRGNVPQIGGEFVGINIACLEMTPKEFGALRVKYQDGRNDSWWNEPNSEETKHL